MTSKGAGHTSLGRTRSSPDRHPRSVAIDDRRSGMGAKYMTCCPCSTAHGML